MKTLVFIGMIGFILLFTGCGDPMTEGVLIGLGTSTAASEAEELAKDNKTALIAKILQLQLERENATSPEEVAIIQDKLDKAEKQQEIALLTASITEQINAGIKRDWGDKPLEGAAGTNNLAYILGSLATVAAGYAGKKQLDSNKQSKAIAAVKIAAKPEDERKVYEALNAGA